MSDNIIRREDMLLIPQIFKYTGTDSIPLTFTYNGKEVKGIPAEFSPKARTYFVDSNIVRTEIEGQNAEGLYIRAEYLEYRDFPVTEWVVFFENRGSADTGIIEKVTLGGNIRGTNPVFTHGTGDDCTENGYRFTTEKVEDKIRITPFSGTSCQGAFPYVRFAFDEYEVRAAIGWTGKWFAETEKTSDGISFICGQDRCHTKLLPGEIMRTPRLDTMIYKADNEFRGINIWRHWVFKHIMPKEDGNQIPPKECVHHYQVNGTPEFTGATEENQIEALRTYFARGLRPDIWWFDAGWYKCDGDWPRVGSWKADPERFPNEIRPLGEECEKYGVQLLLWFEPERVRAGEALDREHPEWLLKRKDGTGDFLLDLGNPEAETWLADYVGQYLTDNHIALYRQDFNFDPLPIWIDNEAEDRIGMLENKHIQGYYAYWDRLLLEHPGLWIDSCASGGRRNDLETMRRAVTLHYTDVGYGKHPIKQLQHREMFEWIPYFRAHNMNWDDPETGSYERIVYGKPDEFAFMCALAPSLTSMIEYYAEDKKMDLGIRMEKIWREAAGLELSGDYYPMTECRGDAHDWYAMQFDDQAKHKGFVQVIRNTLVDDDSFVVRMPQIEDGKTYEFTDRVTGAVRRIPSDMLKLGFEMKLEKRKGVVLFYEVL